MASAGRILIMPKGDWSADTTYEMLDLVYYNGSSWICKKDVQGIEPTSTATEYWQLIATEGNKFAFRTVSKSVGAGQTEYTIDLSEFGNNIIVGVMHQLGEPSFWEFQHVSLHQKSNTEGTIKTDAGNTFVINYMVVYR